MSPRRAETASPLVGCLSKASPVAVQSFNVPDSKSRLSGWPLAPSGLMRAVASAAKRLAVSEHAREQSKSLDFMSAFLDVVMRDLLRRSLLQREHEVWME